MLAVLSQHQVVPLLAKGQPFDPSQMHALGQQADTAVPVNTVVREVVRGYLWQERVLREAQVIVAAPSPDNGPPTS
jgi:molecular chaperone GrpE